MQDLDRKGVMDERQKTKLVEFVGDKKKDYYFKKWQKDNSFNWAAFFLTLLWLGYRKMYKPIFLVLAAFLFIDIFFVVAGIEGTVINRSLGAGLSGWLGVGGNLLYKKHAQKQISIIDQRSLSDKERIHEIHKRGGTSKLGVLLAFLLVVVYIGLALVIYSF
ncbi:DUF2628 domain-containing protein [Fictibacillus nanhaiensis]|uniref:DUF2628 domain-containing protein n=2 Tax=Fictibacillus nanhaiensis TaxID=742169 RepID=A0ABS2ZRJ4_9BACL|nr:DUF2628 domain-containing protein [Fictibacillus nanhaiensis]